MTNASQLFNLAFQNKRRIDNRFSGDGYRLLAEAMADADVRDAGDLPPIAVALGKGDVPDSYGFLELNQEKPRTARIHFDMADEAMLLRIVIDRLSCNKASDELINSLKALVPDVAKASKRAERRPDVEKPAKKEPAEATKEQPK